MNKHQATFLSKATEYQGKFKDNDVTLWCVTCVFRDNYSTQTLISYLSKGSSYGGNHTQVSIWGNRSVISSLLFDEDYELEIPLGKFMKFLHDWQEATKHDPKEITLTRDDEWNIEITTKP